LSTSLAEFTPKTTENYNIVGNVAGAHISLFGKTFSPTVLEERFYLFFIAGMLASLILAIAIKRHIQHVYLVANSSFVVMLACLLWMST